jgi:NAD(P)-dependent dehydrogenase (short-subunit alcohol dehydrogenase family)
MEKYATYHDLEGQSVFITGGGSGIGAALTEGFVQQGAKVAFVQRSDASAFCDRIEGSYGVRPLFIPCDITDVGALKSAMTQAAEAHGRIECLVNNAANDQRRDMMDTDEAFYDKMMDINLKAYFFACQAALEGMLAAGQGTIINFSSISYMMGNGKYPIYTSANAAINAMTRSIARDYGPQGIKANALMPGWVLTQKQLDEHGKPEDLAGHLARQCIPEHLVESDIVGGVLFLASKASRMMTGQALVIDGGVVVTG